MLPKGEVGWQRDTKMIEQIIRDNYATICDELRQVPRWFTWKSDAYGTDGNCLFLTGDWTVCPCYVGNYRPENFIQDMPAEDVVRLCQLLPFRFPAITAILKQIPEANYAAFTRLAPRSRLAPHRHDNPNSRILHMGVNVPPGQTCGLRVEGLGSYVPAYTEHVFVEYRPGCERDHIWDQQGDIIVFDDNKLHSAWNDSDHERILFYVDFRHGLS
jgi:hypothetical protein